MSNFIDGQGLKERGDVMEYSNYSLVKVSSNKSQKDSSMTIDTYYEYASYGTKEYRINVAHKWSKKKVCITWSLYNFQSNTLQIAY